MKKFYQLLTTRKVFWPLLMLPGIWRLVIPAMTDRLGFNPLFELLHRTGDLAACMLAGALALTPLKTLFPRVHLVAALNRHRRAVGVSAFIYASLHVAENFLYEGEFKGYFANIWKPFFLTGTFVLLVLILLGGTSNDFSMRRLGYPAWKWLHRLAYPAALALAWHMGTAGKGNWPAARKVFIPLLALQFLRVGKPFFLRARQMIAKWRHRGEWRDWRDFTVARREAESETITSFYLQPADGRALPPFNPGQFLTVQLDLPNQPKPVVRTYTISDAPNGKTYRLSIKREPAPSADVAPGLVSNHFHDLMPAGVRLRVKPPAGRFYLDAAAKGPVVLLSAGVGIAPMIAMLNSLVAKNPARPVWFLHGARNRREHAFNPHLRKIAWKYSNVRVHVCYSQPEPDDLAHEFCDSQGRVDMRLVKELLPGSDGDFYLCGPGPFMKSLHEGLRAWGVASEKIHYEFFGPTTVKFDGAEYPTAGAAKPVRVEFAPSGLTANWDAADGNLLDLALARGLKPNYGCKAGVCGSCAHRLVRGEVAYSQEPALPAATGCVLLCSARPVSDVVISLDS